VPADADESPNGKWTDGKWTDGQGADGESEGDLTDPPLALRLAAGVVALQALGMLGAAGVLVVKTITGHPHSYAQALSDIALALVGVAVLVLAARGILRGHSGARTPVVLLELLALPVAYSLAFQADLVIYGGPILVTAIAALYLLFTGSARAALDRDI
jgi:hypothetical protein